MIKQSNAWERTLEKVFLKPLLFGFRMQPLGSQPIPPPDKVLLCKSCCLGDAVLSLYALRAFKQAFPKTRIEILCSQRIQEVYQDAACIDIVHALPVTGRHLLREILSPKFSWALFRVLYRLRKSRFNWFVDLELYRGYGPLLKKILGIPFSRGFHVEGLSQPPHNVIFFRGKWMPEWQCFYGVFGLPIPQHPGEPLYASPLSEPERKTSAQEVKPLKKIGVIFGSSFNWPEKKWPLDYFKETLRSMLEYPVEFVLFGLEYETQEGVELQKIDPDRIQNKVGKLDFHDLKKEIQGCDLVFGNDTGTLHVAAACGLPTLTLFGPTVPEKWAPVNGEVLWEPIACRPCYYLGSMPFCSHVNCMKGLLPQAVMSVLIKKLEIQSYSVETTQAP